MEILREYTTKHQVYRINGYVYKEQPKCMTDNEIWFLTHMANSGYVPLCVRASEDTIRMEDLGESQSVTDKEAFLRHLPFILNMLEFKGIRHGDLTEYALIVRDNKPYLIDFAESRFWDDPRPDKRPEGDEYWLTKTMYKLVSHL